ncbi:hypothetical protein AAEX28_05945 [Lentisphaerota bacterium WC36G]|nr:hypothetical protein LJT99_08805 [Lentisphaerae bacterium WC36]
MKKNISLGLTVFGLVAASVLTGCSEEKPLPRVSEGNPWKVRAESLQEGMTLVKDKHGKLPMDYYKEFIAVNKSGDEEKLKALTTETSYKYLKENKHITDHYKKFGEYNIILDRCQFWKNDPKGIFTVNGMHIPLDKNDPKYISSKKFKKINDEWKLVCFPAYK